MIPIWVVYAPNPNEIALQDQDAEKDALASLEPDVRELGYILSNWRVTRLDDAKIIRADILVPGTSRKVGDAIRVIRQGEIEEGIDLPLRDE